MQFPDINALFSPDSLVLFLKIPILIMLALYLIFLFIVISRVKALNRLVHIASAHASTTLQIAAIIQFILCVSLFLLALVIV